MRALFWRLVYCGIVSNLGKYKLLEPLPYGSGPEGLLGRISDPMSARRYKQYNGYF